MTRFWSLINSKSEECLHINTLRMGEGNGNPLQFSCLENPMDRRACWVIVHRVTESETTEQLTHTHVLRMSYFTERAKASI